MNYFGTFGDCNNGFRPLPEPGHLEAMDEFRLAGHQAAQAKTVPVIINLPASLLERIDRVTEVSGIPRDQWIKEVIYSVIDP